MIRVCVVCRVSCVLVYSKVVRTPNKKPLSPARVGGILIYTVFVGIGATFVYFNYAACAQYGAAVAAVAAARMHRSN